MTAAGTTLVGGDSPSGSPLQIGQIVAGKYRIERQIGRGGMGIVLAATHLQLEHLVAIKVMRRDLLEDDQALDRLLVEARAAAKIRSEHVARVLDVGTLESGSPFIVMEYLEGEDLADLLDRRGALEVEQAITFMLQSCEALAEVHVAEMVHRDLKPGNLFIAQLPDGSPTLKIVDFGISKYIGGAARERAATTSPQVLGSPFYMAPEQMRAEAVDERSDIWGLGAILFEMLTGRPPFIGETLPEVYSAVLNDIPPSIESLRPGAPQGLDDVVQRCLAKDPAQRFCDVADLAEALAPFGGPASAVSLERITRILINPEPLRARYSSIPAPPGALALATLEERVGSAPKASASQPLTGGEEHLSPTHSPSGVPTAERWPVRASRTGGELHPLSATGVEPERPRKGRVAWMLTAGLVAVAGGLLWMRSLSPGAAGSVKQRAGTASSVDLSAPPTLGVTSGVTNVVPAAEVPEVMAGAPKHGADVRTEKKALRATPQSPGRSRPSISGAPHAAPVTANERPALSRAERASAPMATPAVEESAKRREADDPSGEEAPVAAPVPPPNASTREARSADPWDPNSFGDRR